MDTDQPEDLARQAKQDEDIYELRLYIAGNRMKSQLAFDNLKKTCDKYLAKKCSIEVIDLTKNPNLAKEDQIIAIPTLVIKNYPGKVLIGDLSNQERVLEFLDLRIDNFLGAITEKIYVVNTPTEESETDVLRSKKSKYDLQSYIGSHSCRWSSQNISFWVF